MNKPDQIPTPTRRLLLRKYIIIPKQLAITIAIAFFLILTTILVVLYARGYYFGIDNGQPRIAGTGILVTTSSPDGAQVLINGHLTTATNNTINLTPGEYTVKIQKEGYFPWEKKITIQNEVVAKADALLLPTAPKLESITAIGVDRPTIDPSETRIAYSVASQSARKNGIYILDMAARPILTLQSSSTQIVDDTFDVFSQASVIWSPNGQEVIASISATPEFTTYYLLKVNGLNQNPQDITTTLPTVMDTWQTEAAEKQKAQLDPLKKDLRNIINNNFAIIKWSLDETKILYVASQSGKIPQIIKPKLIGTNPTPEERSIKKDSVYIYDIKEDRNYLIDILSNTKDNMPVRWLPDSKHLLYVHEKRIDIMDYDGLNRTTIYAGPFIDNYVFPWPNASKILMLTNLNNSNIAPNLYTISLK